MVCEGLDLILTAIKIPHFLNPKDVHLLHLRQVAAAFALLLDKVRFVLLYGHLPGLLGLHDMCGKLLSKLLVRGFELHVFLANLVPVVCVVDAELNPLWVEGHLVTIWARHRPVECAR